MTSTMKGKSSRSLKIGTLLVTSLANLAVLALPALDATAQNVAQPTTLDAPATVHAFFATDLYAKESGYALQIEADIGDHVKAGQVLAVIDNPELQKQFVKTEAAEQQASASLEVSKRRVSGMEADLALQEVTLKRQEQLLCRQSRNPAATR